MLFANILKNTCFSSVGNANIFAGISDLSRVGCPSNISGLIPLVIVDPVNRPSSLSRTMPDIIDNPIPKGGIVMNPLVAHLYAAIKIVPWLYPCRLAPALGIAPRPVEISHVFATRLSVGCLSLLRCLHLKAAAAFGILSKLVPHDNGFFTAVASASPHRVIFWRRTPSKFHDNQLSVTNSSSIFDETVHSRSKMLSLEGVNQNA